MKLFVEPITVFLIIVFLGGTFVSEIHRLKKQIQEPPKELKIIEAPESSKCFFVYTQNGNEVYRDEFNRLCQPKGDKK